MDRPNHWVRDAGNVSMYGLTVRSYNAGVSRTMWTCCSEYCTKKTVQDSGLDCNYGTKWNDLANVHVSGRINDIDLDVWPVLGMAQPAQHPRILVEELLTKSPGGLSN